MRVRENRNRRPAGRILPLLLAGALALGPAGLAQAEEYTGDDGWKVEFDGTKMESTFTSSDISDAIVAIQPGDRITVDLALRNTADFGTDWYMTNEVLSSLEDSQEVAEGGAYSYILTYIGPDGEENVLYDSESVGGEKDSQAGEGLHEATDNLDEYFYLDTLATGQSAAVRLVVALDGETQGNAYQDTLADLQMNFAVEHAQDDNGNNPGNDDNGGNGNDDNGNGSGGSGDNADRQPGSRAQSVDTGDHTPSPLWSAAALVSGGVLLIAALLRIVRRKGGRQREE